VYVCVYVCDCYHSVHHSYELGKKTHTHAYAQARARGVVRVCGGVGVEELAAILDWLDGSSGCELVFGVLGHVLGDCVCVCVCGREIHFVIGAADIHTHPHCSQHSA
jgi:hypothetical protein